MTARLLPLVLLTACGPRLDEDTVGGLRRLSGAVRVGDDGQRRLRLDAAPGEVAALVTVVPQGDARAHVLEATTDGEAVFNAVTEAKGANSTTNAGYLSKAATLNWPRSPADRLDRLEVTVGNVAPDTTYVAGDLWVDVRFKRDDDLEAGALEVALVWAGGTEGDAALVAAMDEALAHWTATYATVDLDLRVVADLTWDDASIDAPVYGTDPAWEVISETVGPNVLPVVITPRIDDVDGVLGVAGDIPGPLAPTTRSGVLVDALSSAGPDGAFNDEETRLLAETLAHEAGHYLGLFHPVENTWDRWDALADTEDCEGQARCENALRELLMFPYPVCGLVQCTPQGVVTADQAAVAHRYTGTTD